MIKRKIFCNRVLGLDLDLGYNFRLCGSRGQNFGLGFGLSLGRGFNFGLGYMVSVFV